MRRLVRGSAIINRWSSISELLAKAGEPTNMPRAHRASLRGSTNITLDEAILLCRKGWREGVVEIEKLRAEIEKLVEGNIPVPTTRYRVTGPGAIHMGRFNQGRPDAFRHKVDSSITRESHVPRILRVVINMSASGAVTHDTFIRRGAALAAAVNVLERRRIRCQIDVVEATTNKLANGATLENVVTVKLPEEATSPDKLAFMLGHPAMLRRIIFSVQEHEDDATRKRFGIGLENGMYGLPGEASDQGEIYVGRILTPTEWSDALTMAWLRKTLSAQGIKLSEKGTV